MIRWLEGGEGSSLPLPAVRIVQAADAADRLRLHRAFAADVLNCDASAVTLGHDEAGRPVLEGSRSLHLSRASRGNVALLALSETPIGVDVELVDASAEPVWSVVHPRERPTLDALAGEERALAFAELWAAKEAYLKLTGTGLRRDPAGIALLQQGTRAFVVDRDARCPIVLRRRGRFVLAAAGEG